MFMYKKQTHVHHLFTGKRGVRSKPIPIPTPQPQSHAYREENRQAIHWKK